MEKILSKKKVYKGRVISVEEVKIDFGNGRKSVFEMAHFNVVTGVSAFPIDGRGQVVLVKHFQLGAGGRILTLPTGGLSKGEDPKERMQSELQEEIGYKAGKLRLMTRAHAIPGYIGTEPFYLYLAQDLKDSKTEGDEVEDISIVRVKFNDLMTKIRNGEIIDNRIILGALYYDKFFK